MQGSAFEFEVGSGHPPRILIVEDDASLRHTLASVLADEGFVADETCDGQQALSLLGEQPWYDLILLDLMMPVVDGWEFRTVLRADPALSEIPVIAMSASATPQARAIHADGYLEKPFTIPEVLATIHHVLLQARCHRLERRILENQHYLSLATMAAGICHEINNPLTYVLGSLDELERQYTAAGPPEAQALIGEIRHGATRIRDILQTLRNRTSVDDTNRGIVPIRMLVESSLALTSHATLTRARITKIIDGDPAVVGNEARLGQVFVNLLVNAGQAIEPGNPDDNEIRIEARQVRDQVIVDVSDTGRGIDPRIRGTLFQPFSTTKNTGEGTGIGLTISREVVLEHGGTLTAEDRPERGATFRVILPARPS